MNIKRQTFPGLLLLVVTLLSGSCETDLERVKEVAAPKEALVETGYDVELIYTEQGDANMKLLAQVLMRYMTQKDPYIEFPEGLRLYFYNADNEIDNHLSANYGIAYEEREEMVVRNDVVVVNVKGEKLNTEELILKQKEKKIYSDKFVKITTADEIIYGEGLEANQDFTDYTIKNIKGTIQLETDELPE